MSHKRGSRSFVVGVNLALCLALALSVAPAGLAGQPTGEEAPNEIISLPLVLKDHIPFIDSSGVLDTSFNDTGLARVNFGGSDEVARGVVLQPDGKLVVAGYLYGAVKNFALARYNLDGSLDSTFGGDGMVTDDFGGQGAHAEAILLQPDGKIVVAGYTITGLDEDFALVRFNPDGSLDTSFSSDGRLQIDFGTRGDRAFAVALDPSDGKIVAAGYTGGDLEADFAVARYNPDGTPDTSFSGDGQVVTDFDCEDSSADYAYAVAVQPLDGKIVVAGTCEYDPFYYYADMVLARYNPDGSLDTSFSSDGLQRYDFGQGTTTGESMLLQPDGRIVVAGTTIVDYPTRKFDFALVRFNADGSLETYAALDFGESHDYGYAVALQADNKLVIAGESQGSEDTDFALARYNPDLYLDTTFGVGGKQVIDVAGSIDRAYAVVARAGGTLVAAGYSAHPWIDFALVQLTIVGTLDSSFSEDGIQFTEFAGSPDRGYAAARQADGKLVVAGLYLPGAPFWGLARINPDGSLDPSFDGDGLVSVNIEGGYARDVAIQADGKIVAVGRTTGRDFIAVRFNVDGSLDTTFAGDGSVVTDIAGDYDYGEAVLLQADGKIIVAGTGSYDFALVRYLPDGSLDPGFDGDGKVIVDFGITSSAYDAALQTDGKILIAGIADPFFGVARLNPDGSLDTTFGGDGMVTTFFGGDTAIADAIAVQPDGKIVAAGYLAAAGGEVIAMARYNPDGSLDSSFSGDGMLTLDYPGGADIGHDLAIQPNGKILLAGVTYGAYSDYALLRLNPDGTLDTAFASGGLMVIDFSGSTDEGYALALMPDGRILVAGFANNGIDYDFAVARVK